MLCVAKCLSVYDIIFRRFTKPFTQCMNSDFSLPFLIMYESSFMAYTFTGYNFLYGNSYLRVLTNNDYTIACIIRLYRHFFGSFSPFEYFISEISSS